MPLPTVGQVITIIPVAPATEKRQGICKFVGQTQFAEGLWVGVELIGSQGKNNGAVNGVQYFTCEPGKGVFIRPELVEERSSESSLGDSDAAKKAEELRAQLEEKTKQLTLKETQLSEALNARDLLDIDLQIALEEKLKLEEDLEFALEELSVLKASEDPEGKLRRELEEVKASNAVLKENNTSLLEQLEAASKSESLIEALTEAKLELEEKYDTLVQQLNKYKGELDEFKTLVDMQDEELSAQKEDLDAHEAELEDLARKHIQQLEEKAAEKQLLHKQFLALEGQLKDLQATSSEGQQQLAIDLRRFKEEASNGRTQRYWDNEWTKLLCKRMSTVQALQGVTIAALPPSTGPYIQLEQAMVLQGCSALSTILTAPDLKGEQGARTFHFETLVALATIHLRVGETASSSNPQPSVFEKLRQLNQVLYQQLPQVARSGSGATEWSTVLSSCLPLTEDVQKLARGSVLSQRSATTTGVVASPAVATLRFLHAESLESVEVLSSVLEEAKAEQVDQQGAENLPPLLSEAAEQLETIRRALQDFEGPLLGVESILQEKGPENVTWTHEASQAIELAMSEMHTFFLPLLTASHQSVDLLDDAKRGVSVGLWTSAAQQLYTWLLGAPRFDGSILLNWLPQAEQGLKLVQLIHGVTSSMKRLWTLLELPSSQSKNNTETVETIPQLHVESISEKLKLALTQVQKVETNTVSSEKVQALEAQLKASQQKQSELQGTVNRVEFDAKAFRERTRELEAQVASLKSSASKAEATAKAREASFHDAFAKVEAESRNLTEQLIHQKKLVQEAASIAPLSQWERLRFKHTIEVYRSFAQDTLLQDYVPLNPRVKSTQQAPLPVSWKVPSMTPMLRL